MTTLRCWQETVGHWHDGRYVWASNDKVALKLAEEAGEVCACMVGDGPPDRQSLADELADVMVVTFALAYRHGIDLQQALTDKTGRLPGWAKENNR